MMTAVRMQLRRGWRHRGDGLFRLLMMLAAVALAAVSILIVYELVSESRPALDAFGFRFLTRNVWDPVHDVFGAVAIVVGTLETAALGLLFALPISIGAAIFLAEFAPAWLRTPGSFLIELLAAIPSVVLGLWGIFVLVPWVRDPVQSSLADALGFLPFFDGPQFGFSVLAAGFILGIMLLPIITALARDTILAVPNEQREASLALGATRAETIRHAVLPYARSGILGAVLLGLGRALGETMAVTMVIGKNFKVTASVFEPGSTAASTLASEFNEASSRIHVASLVELALILLAITLVVNIVGRLLVWRIAQTPRGAFV